MRSNSLYTLLDIHMGGKMVQVFEEEGAEGLRAFCLDNLTNKYLYRGGEEEITHSVYARWRHHQEHKNKEVWYK